MQLFKIGFAHRAVFAAFEAQGADLAGAHKPVNYRGDGIEIDFVHVKVFKPLAHQLRTVHRAVQVAHAVNGLAVYRFPAGSTILSIRFVELLLHSHVLSLKNYPPAEYV